MQVDILLGNFPDLFVYLVSGLVNLHMMGEEWKGIILSKHRQLTLRQRLHSTEVIVTATNAMV